MHLSTDSSLSEWLHYIEAIHSAEIDLGLDRLQQVAGKLITPPLNSFVYTVAGTNGKGTTTAAISALSSAAGLSVGWYSSPHLHRFNERVRINGEPVSDESLVHAFDRVEKARGPVSLSYFEYTTLAAFVVFIEHGLDVWVLEVGLGGRLDAVNIVDPDVSVITSIALDHQDFLGEDIDGIGYEKAGIARKERPLVLGESADNRGVMAAAQSQGATVQQYGDSHGVSDDELYWHDGRLSALNISIPRSNAAVALQAFSSGPGQLTTDQAAEVLNNLSMPGRLQKIKWGRAEMILDVGHNPHAGAYICSQLRGKQFHLIIGMLDNKDAKGFVQELLPVSRSISFVTLDAPRGQTAAALKALCADADSECFGSVQEALDFLSNHAEGEDLFVGGSFYTVQEAMNYLEYSFGS